MMETPILLLYILIGMLVALLLVLFAGDLLFSLLKVRVEVTP